MAIAAPTKVKREVSSPPVLKSNLVSPKEMGFIVKVFNAAGINAEPFNKAVLAKAALSTMELRKLQDKGILKYHTNGLRGMQGHTTVVLLVEPSRLEVRSRGERAGAAAPGRKRHGKPSFLELYEFATIFRKYIENVADSEVRVDPATTPEARELQGHIALAATEGDIVKMQKFVSQLAALHKTIAKTNAPRTKIEVAAERMVRDNAERWEPFLKLLRDSGVR